MKYLTYIAGPSEYLGVENINQEIKKCGKISLQKNYHRTRFYILSIRHINVLPEPQNPLTGSREELRKLKN